MDSHPCKLQGCFNGGYMKTQKLRYYAPVAVCLFLIVFLLVLPTGYEGAAQYQEAEHCIAEVVAVDNSDIVDT